MSSAFSYMGYQVSWEPKGRFFKTTAKEPTYELTPMIYTTGMFGGRETLVSQLKYKIMANSSRASAPFTHLPTTKLIGLHLEYIHINDLYDMRRVKWSATAVNQTLGALSTDFDPASNNFGKPKCTHAGQYILRRLHGVDLTEQDIDAAVAFVNEILPEWHKLEAASKTQEAHKRHVAAKVTPKAFKAFKSRFLATSRKMYDSSWVEETRSKLKLVETEMDEIMPGAKSLMRMPSLMPMFGGMSLYEDGTKSNQEEGTGNASTYASSQDGEHGIVQDKYKSGEGKNSNKNKKKREKQKKKKKAAASSITPESEEGESSESSNIAGP